MIISCIFVAIVSNDFILEMHDLASLVTNTSSKASNRILILPMATVILSLMSASIDSKIGGKTVKIGEKEQSKNDESAVGDKYKLFNI